MSINPVCNTVSPSGDGLGSIHLPRRTFLGSTIGALLATSMRGLGEEGHEFPNNPFIVLLKGLYSPVAAGQGPINNLGLNTSVVNLNDGTYSKTKIYPIFGLSETPDQDRAIGTFYVQFAGDLCAYDLPGGAIAMQFLNPPAGAPPGFDGFVPFSDGAGGYYLEGTFELKILEATGVYRAFQVGHNHMVDRLHQLASGQFSEYCFCNISQYDFP